MVEIDLGFDASDSYNTYSIEVRPERAIFRVNGEMVGDYGPDDLPKGIWDAGPLRSFVNLWATAPGQAEWAGAWEYPDRALIARIEGMTVPEDAETSR